jgi:hypothetical protein
MVMKYGWTHVNAERAYSLGKKSVTHRVSAEAVKDILKEMKLSYQSYSINDLVQLGKIKNRNVLLDAARVAEASGIHGQNLIDLSVEVRKGHTEQAQKAIVAEWEKKIPAIKEAKKYKMNTRTKFLRAVAVLAGLVEGVRSVTQLQISDQKEQKDVKARLTKLRDKLDTLCGRSPSDGRVSKVNQNGSQGSKKRTGVGTKD